MNRKPTLWHLPLEPYKERYTEFLTEWEQHSFGQKFSVETIIPDEQRSVQLVKLTTGEVLDRVNRPLWALQQLGEVLPRLKTQGGRAYFSDFFHPGLEAVAYSGSQVRMGAFCWAQSFDVYDFTIRMLPWMRAWEVMALDIYSAIFVACPMLKELIQAAVPHAASKVHVVGLPFNSQYVYNKVSVIPEKREFDVVYSSRWDVEKNPNEFLDLVETAEAYSFVVCTGHSELRGTDHAAIRRAKEFEAVGRLTIRVGCDKILYYNTLASSKVQINTASQDWVSFTLLEALTFGCLPLYPDFRSFPETLMYEKAYLYRPHDTFSAYEKLEALLDSPPDNFGIFCSDLLNFHDAALDRIADIMLEL